MLQTDDQPTLTIGALAFDPSNPATVYAATGEGNWAYRNLGQGILVSHDGGTTWTLSARQIFAGIGFYRLVVDPPRWPPAVRGDHRRGGCVLQTPARTGPCSTAA